MNATLLNHSEFAEIDRHFARFIATHSSASSDGLPTLAAALLSRNVRLGHICLDLKSGPASFHEPLADFTWPSLDAWRKALAPCNAIGPATKGGAHPLILDEHGLLYLRRYWDYEQALADAILARCAGSTPTAEATDRQQLAIETALARRFVVISGGPGTGKTTTVLKILERLRSQPGGALLRIALAAPTGKAAARLQETLRSRAESAQASLPTASTLHRLLGARPGSVYFRHDATNPLPVDVVVVDEASMVPLPMMAKLFAALPKAASIILLGDRYQLASVEPGAVLGDLADAASVPTTPLAGSLVVLEKNHRFGNQSAIFALCTAVREGLADQALAILRNPAHAEIRAVSVPEPKGLLEALRVRIIEGFSSYLNAPDPVAALQAFQKFRVLCALRTGPFGVENLNEIIATILRDAGLIHGPANAYPGLPILITRNDYQLRLYNGDIGIVFPAPDSDSLVAWFVGEDGAIRQIPPARLPAHEPAFAMTVHKSQGSEFDQVLLLLPNKPSPVLNRELVYTGLTRARTMLEVWFEESVLRAAIALQIQRASGLRELLGSHAELP